MIHIAKGLTLEQCYNHLISAVTEQLNSEKDWLANLSNISAFIPIYITQINWAGFYLAKDDTLVLGPFQGNPACNRIPIGQGVCGTAAKNKECIVVPNVHEFPGHIACDSQSKSEIVLPIMSFGRLFGVLDIDSPVYNRFTEQDASCLLQVTHLISRFLSAA